MRLKPFPGEVWALGAVAVSWAFLCGSVAVLAASPLLLAVQCFLWLRQGTWTRAEISEFLPNGAYVDWPNFRGGSEIYAWLVTQEAWWEFLAAGTALFLFACFLVEGAQLDLTTIRSSARLRQQSASRAG